MNEILGYTRHPASAVWPDLTDEEYTALRDNIDAQGQDHPILVTLDNVVIDGWHRLRACAEIPIKPVTMIAYFDDGEIARKIVGAHEGRRHLPKLERAKFVIATMQAVGMELAPRGRPQETAQNEPFTENSITRENVAEQAGVSEATARRAIQETKEEQAAEAEPEPEPEAEPEQPAPLTAEEITKKAKASAGRARAKTKRAEAQAEELELWRELAETSSTALEALRSELAAEDIDVDEEMRGDLQADAGRNILALSSQLDALHAKLAEEREARKTAEGDAAYWKKYAAEIEAVLQDRMGG